MGQISTTVLYAGGTTHLLIELVLQVALNGKRDRLVHEPSLGHETLKNLGHGGQLRAGGDTR